jgi:phage N-6-adenine-methyltransferase
LKLKLGIGGFQYDLAASAENTVADQFYTEQDDALIQDWAGNMLDGAWAFCNPPYADIEPWVMKACYETEGAGVNVAMLLPASTGSNWWRTYVHNRCYVLLLNGRLTFVGHKTPYPKDLVVLLYTPMRLTGYDVWNWKNDV